MAKSSLSQYRVDNVPLTLRPVFYLYGYGVAILIFIFGLILRTMIKVEISGQENLRKHSNYRLHAASPSLRSRRNVTATNNPIPDTVITPATRSAAMMARPYFPVVGS